MFQFSASDGSRVIDVIALSAYMYITLEHLGYTVSYCHKYVSSHVSLGLLLMLLVTNFSQDTMEAIDVVSKYSGIKPQQFNYAGTKDRRAKTSQRVSVFKVNADKLQRLNSKLRGMAMGDFKYCNVSLSIVSCLSIYWSYVGMKDMTMRTTILYSISCRLL